jgi:hypothetical protein
MAEKKPRLVTSNAARTQNMASPLGRGSFDPELRYFVREGLPKVPIKYNTFQRRRL